LSCQIQQLTCSLLNFLIDFLTSFELKATVFALSMSPKGVPGGQIRVEDKLYSAQKLSEIHPGGPLFIKVRKKIMYGSLVHLAYYM
jgi:hypothetical protein